MWRLFLLLILNLNSIFTFIIPANYSLSDEFINKINKRQSTWRAGRNFPMGVSKEFVRNLMGVHPDAKLYPLPAPKIHNTSLYADLPENFDSREKWSYCPTIAEIRDQGSCGSCWAHGTAETISDRICIHSGGKKIFHVSSHNILACCSYCGYGCKGGIPIRAWDYYINEGVVSGGSYDSNEGCQPYEIEPCEHDGNTNGARPVCQDYLETPKCRKRCTNSEFPQSYKSDLEFGETAYSIVNDPQQIQIEIMTNGPVATTMVVFDDFIHYKSGVYQHIEGERIAEHVIKIIGWGSDNGVPYWLVANSWNTDWGENGFVRILRGVNECGIELQIIGGIPRI